MREEKVRYIQTWKYFPYGRWWSKPCQLICGLFTGHEWSKTESGYGGGPWMDVWCRWCNHNGKIPIAESPQGDRLLEIWNSKPPEVK